MAKYYQPTAVIGLGGTGKKILLALKKMIAENSTNGLKDYPVLRLMAIDTDDAVPVVNSEIESISEQELGLDPNKEVFYLHGGYVGNPDLEAFKEIKEWFPPSLLTYLNSAELKKGAGMKKPIGRFALAWNADELYKTLENLIKNPVDTDMAEGRGIGPHNLSSFTNVFICGSICGGTGAGTFIDIAYMLRHIAKSLSRDVFNYGLFALNTMFDGMAGDTQLKPNCYASLIELDHYSNKIVFQNQYQAFRPQYKQFYYQYTGSAETTPFNFPFLFDRTNEDGKSFVSDTAFADMCSRFIYLLTGHEVAKDYQSMDNNVRKGLENTYIADYLNKPNLYRSMGVHSILFPKRMVKQTCGYLLGRDYLTALLDDSYKSHEIQRMAEGFIGENKLKCTQIEEVYDAFKTTDGLVEPFSGYFQQQIDEYQAPKEKKELRQNLAALRDDMNKMLASFREQNRGRPSETKKLYQAALDQLFANLTDIKLREDAYNEKRRVTGSLRRLEKTISWLSSYSIEQRDVYRKRLEENKMETRRLKEDLDSLLSDIEEASRGLFGGSLPAKTQEFRTTLQSYLEAGRQEIICNNIFQLFNNILDNAKVDEEGMIRELEKRLSDCKKLVNDFESTQKTVESYIQNNKTYNGTGSFSTVLYDYPNDVEGTYSKVTAEIGQDELYSQLSNTLKQLDYGPRFEKCLVKSPASITKCLISQSEKFFFAAVDSINIEDKILADDKIRENLRNGVYRSNAGVFAKLDNQELSKVNLSLKNTSFFAITIPNTYEGKPCSDIRGYASCGAKCPLDKDPEKYKILPDGGCLKYSMGCLKKIILDSSPKELAVVPSDEFSEINVIKAVAGFPLHSLVSAMNGCRPAYLQLKEKHKQEDKNRTGFEERIHMYGAIKMADLSEMTVDSTTQIEKFKTQLLLAVARGRLVAQKLDFSFYTEQDLQFEKQTPSLFLGANLEDVIRRMQSNRLEDMEVIGQFRSEIDLQIERMLTDDAKKDRLFGQMSTLFKDFNTGVVTEGFHSKDANLLDQFASQRFGKPLFQQQKKDIDL